MTGFELVVGTGVTLLAVLQVLILAWLVDIAKATRPRQAPTPMAGVLTPEYQQLNGEFQLHKLVSQRQIDNLRAQLAEDATAAQLERP